MSTDSFFFFFVIQNFENISMLVILMIGLLFKYKLSRGEICVAHFIPPCEWCKSGQFFCVQNLDLG